MTVFTHTFSSISTELLQKDSFKRSFCPSVEESDIIFDGSEETIPAISVERSIALSNANTQYFVDSGVAPWNGVKVLSSKGTLIYSETDPSRETHRSLMRNLYYPEYSLDQQASMIKAYRPPSPTKPFNSVVRPDQADVLHGLLRGPGFVQYSLSKKGPYIFNYNGPFHKLFY